MIMDLYIERIKKKLQNIVESGMYDESQVMAAIDDTLDNILLYKKDDNGWDEMIEDFQDSNEGLTKEIMDARKKISDNYKNIYKQIIKEDKDG